MDAAPKELVEVKFNFGQPLSDNPHTLFSGQLRFSQKSQLHLNFGGIDPKNTVFVGIQCRSDFVDEIVKLINQSGQQSEMHLLKWLAMLRQELKITAHNNNGLWLTIQNQQGGNDLSSWLQEVSQQIKRLVHSECKLQAKIISNKSGEDLYQAIRESKFDQLLQNICADVKMDTQILRTFYQLTEKGTHDFEVWFEVWKRLKNFKLSINMHDKLPASIHSFLKLLGSQHLTEIFNVSQPFMDKYRKYLGNKLQVVFNISNTLTLDLQLNVQIWDLIKLISLQAHSYD